MQRAIKKIIEKYFQKISAFLVRKSVATQCALTTVERPQFCTKNRQKKRTFIHTRLQKGLQKRKKSPGHRRDFFM
jgi:hypothetical protein